MSGIDIYIYIYILTPSIYSYFSILLKPVLFLWKRFPSMYLKKNIVNSYLKTRYSIFFW